MSGERAALIALAHQLLDDGLVVRTWGNVSVRLPEGGFVITPSGRSYTSMREADLPVVQLDESWVGPYRPSSELPMHALVYRGRPKVGCVVHTHQPYASALSQSGADVRLDAAQRGRLGQDRIPLAAYGLPGTKQLHRGVERALDGFSGHAVLMRAHGALVFAATPDEARRLARGLEAVAREVYTEIVGPSPAPVPTDVARSELADGQIRYFDESGERVTPSIATRQRHEAVYRARPRTRAVVATSDPEVLACGPVLKPYLDDFAQIAGLQADASGRRTVTLAPDVALCAGRDADEAANVRLVLEKNARAARVARASGRKPIAAWECLLMNRVYQLKYSKLG